MHSSATFGRQTLLGVHRLLVFLILCLLLACGARAEDRPVAGVSNTLYFVQLTDTHWGSKDHVDVTAKLVNEINGLPFDIACVVVTGDMVADAMHRTNLVKAGLFQLHRLKMPVHFLPGNHDIKASRLDQHLSVYQQFFGELCYRQDYGDTTFLFVYDEPLRNPESHAIKEYRPLDWMERSLAAISNRSTIVFHHVPCVRDFYNRTLYHGWPEEAGARWVALLNKYHVSAAVAGHFHRDELHWLGEVPLYVAPPVARYWGRQPSYRIYAYRDGRLGYRTQYLEP